MPAKYGLVEDHGGNVIKPVKGAGNDMDQKRKDAIAAKEQARENKERERGAARGAAPRSPVQGAGAAPSLAAQKKADMEAKRDAETRKKGEERAEKIKVAEEKRERQREADALKPKLSSAK